MRRSLILLLIVSSWACSDSPHPATNDAAQPDSGLSTHDADGTDLGRDAAVADAQTTDARTTDMAVAPTGDPIEAPLETWTWVDFPNAVCGNGAPTGIGVNLTDRSDDVMVYFMGGGACWDVNTCFVLNAAVNIQSGYTGANFASDPIRTAAGFDRDAAANPFADMSYVFVPYCTGDVHAGDKVTTYMALGQTREVHHVGAANVAEFLARLAPTFPDAQRVFVSGSSAGGYGAQLNFHRFVAAFPDAEVHVLADSGPLLQPYGARFGEMNAAWTFQTPPGCTDCGDGFPQWFDYLVTTYSSSRFGLLTYDSDQTIHLYFGYPAGNSFHDALSVFLDDHFDAVDHAQVFELAGTNHVLLGGLTTLQAPNGTTLSDWTGAFIDGAGWTSVRP